MVSVAFVAAVALLTAFVVVERRRERSGRDPLFEFAELRHRGFRYGLITTGILALGQLALIVVLSVFLQGAARLSAVEVGVWLIPLGASIVLGARLGAIVAHRFGAIATVRWGLVFQVVGLLLIVLRIAPGITFWELAAGLVVYGPGIGASSAQLVNVILSDVDPAKSGVASGTNSTVRQVGAALGIALVSTILTEQTIHHTAANIRAANLPAKLQSRTIELLDHLGTSFSPPRGVRPGDSITLVHALADGLSAAARPALWFALATMVVGLALSFLMPRGAPPPRSHRYRVPLLQSDCPEGADNVVATG